jgi:zinc/manganese transport system permease protein
VIEFLVLPALACVALVAIHAYFGLQVLERNVIFVDLALAQVAALGATAAFMLGHPPQSLAAYAYSLACTMLAAALLAFTRRWGGRVPQEAQIGVIYVVAAAAALLLVDRAPQGAEHIRQILTGNILTAGWPEVCNAIVLYALVGAVYPFLARRIEGRGWISEFAFYAAFGLVVTSSVALAGVLLVFAFLIIPAAIGALLADSFRRRLFVAWIVGSVVAFAGLAISYAFDLSTGATLVCGYGFALALAGLGRMPRLLSTVRWGIAAALAASALLIAIAPRQDQPLLDTLEAIWPRVRHAYMDDKALAIAQDAESYASRYRTEAERMRAREAERRWKGEPMEELEVRRTASFLKSYNEMIGGETFVAREVRSRAREERRFAIAALFLVAAAALVINALRRAAGIVRR